MKKVFLIIISVLCIFCLTGCGKKKVSVEEFLSVTGKYGYIPSDVTSEAQKGNPKIVQSISLVSNNGIEIQFHVLEDMNSTLNKYTVTQRNVESYRIEGYLFSTDATTNYESYALNTKDNYYYVSRVDETLLYIKGNYKDKDEIVKFIEEIGY